VRHAGTNSSAAARRRGVLNPRTYWREAGVEYFCAWLSLGHADAMFFHDP
jgi:hypothetical protein